MDPIRVFARKMILLMAARKWAILAGERVNVYDGEKMAI
jgi:hypothetical protein